MSSARSRTASRRSLLRLIAPVITSLLLLAGCGGGGGGGGSSVVVPPTPTPPTPPVNRAPVADAGGTWRVAMLTHVQLNGSNSSDPDQDQLSYRWTLKERPPTSRAEIVGDTLVAATLTPDVPGRFLVSLEVSDGKLSSTATKELLVNHPPTLNYQKPAARIRLGEQVSFDASASTDEDGDKLTFEWRLFTKPEGSKLELGDASTSKLSFVPDQPGSYQVQLSALDGLSTSSSWYVFRVNSGPTAAIAPVEKLVPTNVALTLNGSGSKDPDQEALRYSWTVISAPAGSSAKPAEPASAITYIRPDRSGTYRLGLQVDDGMATSSVAEIQFTANYPPVASFGRRYPLVPGENMELNGSDYSSDQDGDALSYEWSILSTPGGASASIADPKARNAQLIATKGGLYKIRLTVSDGKSSSTITQDVPVDNRPITRIKFSKNVKMGEPMVFDASESSDADGDAMTFWWYLHSKPKDSKLTLGMMPGTSARFELLGDVPGYYAVMAGIMSGYSGSNSTQVNYVLVGGTAPTAQINAPATTPATSTVWLDGSSSSSVDGQLTYRWTLVSVPKNSRATLSSPYSPQTQLKTDVAGSYVVSLVVSDGMQTSAAATATIQALGAEPRQPAVPTITPPATTITEGEEAEFSANAIDPGGLPLFYTWTFADGTTATGSTVRYRFRSAGAHEVRVTATNTLGLSNSASLTLRVAFLYTGAPMPACSGSKCAAVSANRYAGSGAGIWMLANNGTSDLSVKVDIDNVSPDRKVLLLLSNGGTQDYPVQPSFGITPAMGAANSARAQAAKSVVKKASASADRRLLLSPQAEAHDKIRKLNDKLLNDYAKSGKGQQTAQQLRKRLSVQSVQTRPAPALYSTRSWNGSLGEPAYETSAESICRAPNGRNIVFWADRGAMARGTLSAAIIDEFNRFFCGNDGAFARLTALTGDVWGEHADAGLIGDGPLQDVNVILGDPGQDTFWGGYYSLGNSYLKSTYAGSNEALAFFLNVRLMGSSKLFLMSSLVHEAMHMVNAYQRTIKRGLMHESWLEETTAMMAEDIVVASLLKNNDGQPHNDMTTGRIPGYMGWSGSYGYIGPGWGGGTYAAGGSFGAFLNRRYGLGLFKRVLNECSGYSITQNSYQCIDQSIKALGGQGFADEFARMAVALMAPLSAAEAPPGFSYPLVQEGIYMLTAFDPTLYMSSHRDNSIRHYEDFQRTSLAYISDAVPSGSSRYRRNGIVVPVGATLSVVIH